MVQHHSIKVPTIKVEIQTKDKDGNEIALDLNQYGLTSLRFERYLSDTSHRASNILTELDMTLYDNTGYNLLSYVQNAKGNLFIRYGFEGKLSPVYRITPTRYNVVYNNRGSMIGVGGFALQNEYQTEAEAYPEKTNIKQLILSFAVRNGWYTNNGKYIDIPVDFITPNFIYRPAGVSDWNFIKSELLPLISTHSVYEDSSQQKLVTNYPYFYDAILQENSSMLELYVFPMKQRKIERNVWKYDYGFDTHSQVIELTNKINYDWIVNGLALRIPLVGKYSIQSDDSLRKEIDTLLTTYKEDIINLFEKNGLVMPELRSLPFTFQFYEADITEYKKPHEIIEEQLRKLVEVLNTIELTVVGNPHIMATDLVRLTVKNKDGLETIQTGDWRVTKITEVIGLGGYQTKLELVRDLDIDFNIPKKRAAKGNIKMGTKSSGRTTITNEVMPSVKLEKLEDSD